MFYLILILVFLTVIILSYQFFSIKPKISIPQAPGRKIKPTVSDETETREKSYLKTFTENLILQISVSVSKSKSPLISKWQNWAKKQLIIANYPYGLTPEKFVANQIFVFAGMTLLGILFLWLIEEFNLVYLLVFAGLGIYLPIYWIKTKITLRQRSIVRSLPDVLDILTLSVEAGLDFNAALVRVTEQEKGPLVEEIYQMQQEVRLGKTREEAFRDMAKRIELPSVDTTVSSLVQALQLGTSLGFTLRSLADQLRTQRFQRTEKLAREAPVKMLLPLLLLILPAVFLILFGPIVLSFFQTGF